MSFNFGGASASSSTGANQTTASKGFSFGSSGSSSSAGTGGGFSLSSAGNQSSGAATGFGLSGTTAGATSGATDSNDPNKTKKSSVTFSLPSTANSSAASTGSSGGGFGGTSTGTTGTTGTTGGFGGGFGGASTGTTGTTGGFGGGLGGTSTGTTGTTGTTGGFGGGFGAKSFNSTSGGGFGTSTGGDAQSLPPTLDTPYSKLPQVIKESIDGTYRDFITPTRNVLDKIKQEGQSSSSDVGSLEALNVSLKKAAVTATRLDNRQKRLQYIANSLREEARRDFSDGRKYGQWALMQIRRYKLHQRELNQQQQAQLPGGVGQTAGQELTNAHAQYTLPHHKTSEATRPPLDFYSAVIYRLEDRLERYAEEIEAIQHQLHGMHSEYAVSSSYHDEVGAVAQHGQRVRIGTQQLVEQLQRQHSAFLSVAARMAETHEHCNRMREMFLKHLRKVDKRGGDPFAEEDRREASERRQQQRRAMQGVDGGTVPPTGVIPSQIPGQTNATPGGFGGSLGGFGSTNNSLGGFGTSTGGFGSATGGTGGFGASSSGTGGFGAASSTGIGGFGSGATGGFGTSTGTSGGFGSGATGGFGTSTGASGGFAASSSSFGPSGFGQSNNSFGGGSSGGGSKGVKKKSGRK